MNFVWLNVSLYRLECSGPLNRDVLLYLFRRKSFCSTSDCALLSGGTLNRNRIYRKCRHVKFRSAPKRQGVDRRRSETSTTAKATQLGNHPPLATPACIGHLEQLSCPALIPSTSRMLPVASGTVHRPSGHTLMKANKRRSSCPDSRSSGPPENLRQSFGLR